MARCRSCSCSVNFVLLMKGNVANVFGRVAYLTGMSESSLRRKWEEFCSTRCVPDVSIVPRGRLPGTLCKLNKSDAAALGNECLRLRLETMQPVELTDLAIFLERERGQKVSRSTLQCFLHKMHFVFIKRRKEDIKKESDDILQRRAAERFRNNFHIQLDTYRISNT